MKVLIVRLSAIGDVIQGIPCLVALKESFPEWKISWLVEETSAPLLEGHPYIEKLFVLGRDWRKKKVGLTSKDYSSGLKQMWNMWQSLRCERFDIAIDLQGLFKSGLWTYLSRAERRIGYDKTREGAHLFLNEYVSDRPTFDPNFSLIDRYVEPAKFLGADVSKPHYVLPPASTDIVSEVQSLFASAQLLGEKNFVALCPWSAWPSKNWPLEFWQELIRSLGTNFKFLIIGSHTETKDAEELSQNHPNVVNLVGKTPIRLLPEIFRHCRLVIGPDTGPIHLANATGGPRVLMLFGSTSWRRSGPLGKQHQAISLDLPCQPCFKRVCPLDHLNCLRTLPVKSIVDKAVEMIS
jgi:heptosyltransferase I